MINWAGPWGTGPYQLVEGASTPTTRSDRIVLEANLSYWDHTRMPKLRRIIFDNTLEQHLAVAQVKTDEGHVDIVTDLRPLETLRVAQSPSARDRLRYASARQARDTARPRQRSWPSRRASAPSRGGCPDYASCGRGRAVPPAGASEATAAGAGRGSPAISGIDVRLWPHAATEAEGDLLCIERIVCGLTARDGFHGERLPAATRNAFAGTQIGQPGPR